MIWLFAYNNPRSHFRSTVPQCCNKCNFIALFIVCNRSKCVCKMIRLTTMIVKSMKCSFAKVEIHNQANNNGQMTENM